MILNTNRSSRLHAFLAVLLDTMSRNVELDVKDFVLTGSHSFFLSSVH